MLFDPKTLKSYLLEALNAIDVPIGQSELDFAKRHNYDDHFRLKLPAKSDVIIFEPVLKEFIAPKAIGPHAVPNFGTSIGATFKTGDAPDIYFVHITVVQDISPGNIFTVTIK